MLKFFDKGDKGDNEVAGEDVSSSDAEEDESSKKKKKPRKKTSVDVLPSHVRDFIGSIVRNMERQHLSGLNQFAIVAIMDFGQQLVDFCTELKEMKDARVVIECGCYEGPRLHREVEFNFPCWQLVYALISLGYQDYQPSLKDSVQMRPYSMEYQPKGAGEDLVEEKGTAAIQTNIKIKAPLWGFVGMASPDVPRICIQFRDVIYFANSQEEAEFIGKYGKSLVSYSERVKHRFAKYKSAKKPASTIQQPAILAKEHANTQDDHISADQKEKAPFVFDEVFTTDALERLDGEPEDVDNVHSNNPRGLDHAEHIIKKQDSNDQGSLFQVVQQRNVEECEEEGPLALALNYCRSLGSSHFDDLETVPLVQSREPSMQPNVLIIPSQTLH
ncbi:hypothetical protein R1sor_008841 [Riccia sorocarpa]|uniref:Uncharacterized protein n=1 Tax=Riccia sorocarpa TaxID=122646 RepID=A0ABD3H430_9MARC